MRNDRELLVLAAEAAGLPFAGAPFYAQGADMDEWGLLKPPPSDRHHQFWNPLTNDGDALRLAVALAERFGFVIAISIGMGRSGCEFNFVDGPDQGANTRRAIVVAAAEIGAKL